MCAPCVPLLRVGETFGTGCTPARRTMEIRCTTQASPMIVGTKGSDPGGTPPESKKLLGQVLKDMELVTEPQIEGALAIQRTTAGRIGQILFTLGYVAKEEILLALAHQQGIDPEDLADIEDLRDVL